MHDLAVQLNRRPRAPRLQIAVFEVQCPAQPRPLAPPGHRAHQPANHRNPHAGHDIPPLERQEARLPPPAPPRTYSPPPHDRQKPHLPPPPFSSPPNKIPNRDSLLFPPPPTLPPPATAALAQTTTFEAADLHISPHGSEGGGLGESGS